MNSLNVAYVLLRFPRLTETFVAEEIQKLQLIGVKVHLFSLLPPKKELVHSVSMELAPQSHQAAEIYSPSLWWAQLYFLLRAPNQYFRLLWVILAQPAPELTFILKRIIVFLKAVGLAKEIEKTPVQVVHTHFAWLSAAAGLVVSQLLNLPFTVTTHAYDIYSQRNDLLRLTTRMADRIVTISEYNKRAMIEMSPTLNGEKVEVIHCGIDLDQFKVIEKESNNEVLNLTSVGSLVEKKGHEYLILACKELEEQGINFRCVIVGGGKLRQQLQDLISDLDLEGKVILAGTKKQKWVRERLNESDIFALACVVAEDGGRDGIPVAIMEALATEVPVISTTVSGIPELILHEETGLIVPEKDADALSVAITRLVKDKHLRKKLARNGRQFVISDFNINNNTAQLANMFHNTIKQHRYKH